MIRVLAFLLVMSLVSPALAEEKSYCAIRTADNVTVGCWNLDPQVYPPPDGTFYVEDPNHLGGAGLVYDAATKTWLPAPLTPEQQASKDATVAREAREAELKAIADVQAMIDRLKTATPAQIDTWVDSNMSNLAQARAVMKSLLKVLAYSLRGL